jgi:hypothetical protein
MISSTNDLSTHLLDNRQSEEDDENDIDCDEEEGCMPSCTPKIMDDEELEEDSQSRSNDKNEQSSPIFCPSRSPL